MPTPDQADADRELVRRAARSTACHGGPPATIGRMSVARPRPPSTARRAGEGACDRGRLAPAGYQHAEARLPGRSDSRPVEPVRPVAGSDRAERCSTSSTASRSTPRRRSGSGYYVCRSCSRSDRRASTSRPTGRRHGCWSAAPMPSRTRRAAEAPPSCGCSRAGWASTMSSSSRAAPGAVAHRGGALCRLTRRSWEGALLGEQRWGDHRYKGARRER
jgi:hypothetical protein